MTHRDLLELCYYSRTGEIKGVWLYPAFQGAQALIWGPCRPDGRPREVRVRILNNYDGVWTWVQPHRDERLPRPWWGEVYPGAQEWLLALDWKVIKPKAPLVMLADDRNPYA